MRVDTHISCSAGKRFTLTIRNVLLCFWVTVLLRHTKIDDMDDISSFRVWTSNEEVVGFDVTVDEVLFVDCLNSRQL